MGCHSAAYILAMPRSSGQLIEGRSSYFIMSSTSSLYTLLSDTNIVTEEEERKIKKEFHDVEWSVQRSSLFRDWDDIS